MGEDERAEGVTESPQEIRRDIAATRARMDGTIDAIEQKLRPRALAHKAADAVSAKAADAARRAQAGAERLGIEAADSARRNPAAIAVGLVATGAVMLLAQVGRLRRRTHA